MIKFVFPIVLPALLASCSSASWDEVAREESPSGSIDAVLFETNGGATTSFGYLVYLVPHGQRPHRRGEVAMLYGATRNEHAYGASLHWDAPQLLIVEYFRAQRAELRHPEMVVVGADTVDVGFRAGVADTLAQPGGMLHNLKPRP